MHWPSPGSVAEIAETVEWGAACCLKMSWRCLSPSASWHLLIRGGVYHGVILVVTLLRKVLVIVSPFVATCALAGEGLASREKAGVADLLLLNVNGARETQATPLEGDDMAFSLSVSTLWVARTSLASTRSPCSWSGLGKVVVVPYGYSEGIRWAKVVNKSSSTSDNPNSTSKGKSALWRAKAKVIEQKLATIPAAEAMKGTASMEVPKHS